MKRHFIIPTNDLEKSVRLYTQYLGFELHKTAASWFKKRRFYIMKGKQAFFLEEVTEAVVPSPYVEIIVESLLEFKSLITELQLNIGDVKLQKIRSTPIIHQATLEYCNPIKILYKENA